MLDFFATSRTYHEMPWPWQKAFGAISLAAEKIHLQADVVWQEELNGGNISTGTE